MRRSAPLRPLGPTLNGKSNYEGSARRNDEEPEICALKYGLQVLKISEVKGPRLGSGTMLGEQRNFLLPRVAFYKIRQHGSLKNKSLVEGELPIRRVRKKAIGVKLKRG